MLACLFRSNHRGKMRDMNRGATGGLDTLWIIRDTENMWFYWALIARTVEKRTKKNRPSVNKTLQVVFTRMKPG